MKSMESRVRAIACASFAIALAARVANAQGAYTEIEPNNSKLEATPIIGIAGADTISGTTTGSSNTPGSIQLGTADVYRVKTAALPPGIYRHRLTLVGAAPGMEGTIRGLDQAGVFGVGGSAGTVDTLVQASSSATNPPQFNQWYGFGAQEEIYYRVTGNSATTAPYFAAYSSTPIPITVIAPTFAPGSISISTVGQANVDTEIFVYDASFHAIPGYLNDDEPTGASTRSTLTRSFAPGTYYLGVGGTNCRTNEPAAPDDRYFFDNLLDFQDAVVRDATSLLAQTWNFSIAASNGTHFVQSALPANSPYDVAWFTFTVANGSSPIFPPPPVNDSCSQATLVYENGTFTGTLVSATNDGSSACDPSGHDVWYHYVNPSVCFNRLLDVSTCGSATDTVVTVYSSCGGTVLACNDNCSGQPCASPASCLSGVVVAPSQDVQIRVSDKGNANPTTFSLRITASNPILPAPLNDNCATPQILIGPGTYCYDTTSATTGVAGQSNALCTNAFGFTLIGEDEWFTYRASTNGMVTVSTCGLLPAPPSPGIDSKIAIYTGVGCPTAQAIACNDDAGESGGPTCTVGLQTNQNSIVEFPATCGQFYTIQIGTSPFSSSGASGRFSVVEAQPTCQPPPAPPPATAYCFGNGSDAACPCGNPGLANRGCNNSANVGGAQLVKSGTASASADTLLLTGANAIPFGPGLYYQGDAGSNPTAPFGSPWGVPFGNGLLCVGGTTRRLQLVNPASSAGLSQTSVQLGLAGGVVAGNTYYYQLWYRDLPNFGMCSAGFNFSHALGITWVP